MISAKMATLKITLSLAEDKSHHSSWQQAAGRMKCAYTTLRYTIGQNVNGASWLAESTNFSANGTETTGAAPLQLHETFSLNDSLQKEISLINNIIFVYM